MRKQNLTGFPARLSSACDDHPHIPVQGEGRQKYIAKALKVSEEAVRKWQVGLARPRHEKMVSLAKLLRVDPAWLALGVEPEFAHPAERREYRAGLDGAVYQVFGAMMADGYACAFAEDRTAHFFAIKDGVQHAVYVAVGEPAGGKYRFDLPLEHSEADVQGLVRTGYCRADVLALPATEINRHGRREGRRVVVEVEKVGRKYMTGKHIWRLL